MKIRDTRLWAIAVAIAFVVLWCISIGITCSSAAQELIAEPVMTATTAPQIQVIGICGWAIVGAGTLCVVGTIVAACRTPRRHKTKSYRSVRPSRYGYKRIFGRR